MSKNADVSNFLIQWVVLAPVAGGQVVEEGSERGDGPCKSAGQEECWSLLIGWERFNLLFRAVGWKW